MSSVTELYDNDCIWIYSITLLFFIFFIYNNICTSGRSGVTRRSFVTKKEKKIVSIELAP